MARSHCGVSVQALAAQLHVSAQTIYDLRSQGRVPTGFRVGRHRGRFTAYTRYRDTDGCLRQVKAAWTSHTNAVSKLKNSLLTRAAVFLDNYTLGEITTGRVEAFLKAERVMSYSRAKYAGTMRNLLFGFALRHDAMARNPVEGTSSLRKPTGSPKALTLDQIQRIRAAAAIWRTGPSVKGPKPDGIVRDALEVLLGTGVRPGSGTLRQTHPKTDASVRTIPVPDFAACHLGHASTAITEAHYIEPDRTVDFEPALALDRTLRPVSPDGSLLARPVTDEEASTLEELDAAKDDGAA